MMNHGGIQILRSTLTNNEGVINGVEGFRCVHKEEEVGILLTMIGVDEVLTFLPFRKPCCEREMKSWSEGVMAAARALATIRLSELVTEIGCVSLIRSEKGLGMIKRRALL